MAALIGLARRRAIAWLAPLLVCSSATAAPLAQGDLGCDTLQTQRERMSALKVAMQTGVMKAQGNASPQMLDLNRTATARFGDLSRERCRALHGTFKVLERPAHRRWQRIALQATKTEALWVLMK